MKIVQALLLVLVAVGCDKKAGEPGDGTKPKPGAAEEAKSDQAKADQAAPSAPAAEEPPPAPAGPCLVGTWRATDFVAKVRRQIGSQIKGAGGKLTAGGGTMDFEFQPPGPDGAGQVIAAAQDMIYRADFSQQGVKVDVTITIKGKATMPYKMPADGELTMDKASDGELKLTAVVKGSGVAKFSKSQSEDVKFADDYVYECNGDELLLWEKPKSGDPLKFDRQK